MTLKTKRVYDKPEKSDGIRILVDRLWPRGLTKERALLDLWLKDIAPSDSLRKWFSHEEAKWNEFKRRYFRELDDKTEQVGLILNKASGETVTLLFGAKDEKFNNAEALREYLSKKAR